MVWSSKENELFKGIQKDSALRLILKQFPWRYDSTIFCM